MKLIKLFICLTLISIGIQSTSYAASPIEYRGAAYWGESHIYSVTPSDPRIGIPPPTEFSEGLAEDVLSQYFLGEHDYYMGPYLSGSSAHVAHVCLRLSASGDYCSHSTYHWAVERKLTCDGIDLPNADYRNCVTPTNLYTVYKDDVVEKNPYDAGQDDENPDCKKPPSKTPRPKSKTPRPIDTKDGNKSRLENDYTASGISPISFTRYYNSQKNQNSYIGYNWKHNYTASLTAKFHTQTVPYDFNDANFSTAYVTAKEACESGWNDIKGQFTKPEMANSNAVYSGSKCSIANAGLPMGSIAVRTTDGVSPNPPQDTVIIERANGNTIVFTSVNSIWTAPSDTDASLVQTASGYTLTTEQDTVEEYNLSGQLVSKTDRKGIQQTLAYNATSNLLESVTDSFGKSLNFTYTDSALTTVTLPDSKVLTYGYDGSNNLTSVKREDNTTRTYHYEDTRFANALTGITNGNNERHMTFSYDAQGRAITSELGDGTSFSAEKVIVNYIDDATSTVTDALGQLRTYRFTTVNGEKQLSDLEGSPCGSCGGGATHTTYDGNGYVNSSTDFNGNVTNLINNARGLVTKRTEATGTNDERITSYEWHTSYPLPTCVIKETSTTRIAYNADGTIDSRTVIDTSDGALFTTAASKVCATIEARTDYANLNKRNTSYTYFPNYGLVKTIDGARTDINDVTSFTYDPAGNLESITNALGYVTQLKKYTARGKPQELIDANELVTAITYDVRGRIDLVTVGTLTTDYDYDGVGNLEKVTQANGSFIEYSYDAAHRLTDVRDQLDNHIHYTLDALGNRKGTDIKDVSGTLKRTSTAVFNQLGQLSITIGAATQTTDYLLYDNNGNLKHTRDAGLHNSYYDYDALNRLTTTTKDLDVTNGISTVSSYTYDALDNIKTVTDTNGLITTYSYNGLGNKMQLDSPDTGITNYNNYDGAGNLLSMTDARDKTTTYTYDALNRIENIFYADGTKVTYYFDGCLNGKGRLCSVVYGGFAGDTTTSWTYDDHGRITQRSESNAGVTLTSLYSYDVKGQLETMTTPGGKTVTYNYTNAQVTRVNVGGAIALENISYDPFGPVNKWKFGNGAVVSRNYNKDGQLDTYSMGNTTHDNNYSPSGNVQAILDLTNAANNQSYDYDALYRLTSSQNSAGNESYAYDKNGNRTSHTVNTTTYNNTISATNNRLITAGGSQAKTYSYDEAGNILSDGQHTYGYDARGRLDSIDNDAVKYVLNALGQRVRKLSNQALLQGDANVDGIVDSKDVDNISNRIFGITAPTISQDCNNDNVVNIQDIVCTNKLIGVASAPVPVTAQTRFAYTEDGKHLGDYDVNGNALQEVIWFAGLPVAVSQTDNLFYVYSDHLGTPRVITNQANTTVWQWQSDGFGKTAANEDPDGDGNPFAFNLRFAGQYYDVETGLHYNYFRDYDPSTGRYVQSDPIGLAGGLNTYGYVRGNPLKYVDALGLVTAVIHVDGAIPHSALYITRGNISYLYDPAGSYTPSSGEQRGSGDFFEGGNASISDYIKYHNDAGDTVTLNPILTTPDQEKELIDRLIEQGGASGGFCAGAVSNVLNGVCNVKSSLWPSSLSENASNSQCKVSK